MKKGVFRFEIALGLFFHFFLRKQALKKGVWRSEIALEHFFWEASLGKGNPEIWDCFRIIFWTFCLVQSLLGQLLCSTCTSLASSLVTHDAMKYQALQNHSSTETLSEHWSYSRSAIFSTTRILQTSTNTIGTQCLSFTVRWMIDRGTPWPQLNFQISRVIIMTEVYVARFLKMAGSNEPFINRFDAASIVLHHIVSKELSFDDLKFKAEGERTVDRTYLKIEWNHFNRCLDLAANITHSSPFRFRTLLASQA